MNNLDIEEHAIINPKLKNIFFSHKNNQGNNNNNINNSNLENFLNQFIKRNKNLNNYNLNFSKTSLEYEKLNKSQSMKNNRFNSITLIKPANNNNKNILPEFYKCIKINVLLFFYN